MANLKFKSKDMQKDIIVLEGEDGEEYTVKLNEILKDEDDIEALSKAQAKVEKLQSEVKAAKTGTKLNAPTKVVERAPQISLPETDTVISIGEISVLARAGMSAAEISERYTVDPKLVAKYANQVEREKMFILGRFQSLPAQSDQPGKTLLDSANVFFDENGVKRDEVKWVAARRKREPWEVRAEFELNGEEVQAIWLWEPRNNVITEINDIARSATNYWLDAEKLVDEGAVDDFEESLVSGVREYHDRVVKLSDKSTLKYQQLRESLDNSFENIDKARSNIRQKEAVSCAATAFSATETPAASLTVATATASANIRTPKTSLLSKLATSSQPLVQKGSASAKPRTQKTSSLAETELLKVPVEASAKPAAKAPAASQPTTAEKDPTTAELEELNTTGAFRRRFSIGKPKRVKVPAWTDAMMPTVD